jgi:hypothetical protein
MTRECKDSFEYEYKRKIAKRETIQCGNIWLGKISHRRQNMGVN